jgi:hypothetical protein
MSRVHNGTDYAVIEFQIGFIRLPSIPPFGFCTFARLEPKNYVL